MNFLRGTTDAKTGCRLDENILSLTRNCTRILSPDLFLKVGKAQCGLTLRKRETKRFSVDGGMLKIKQFIARHHLKSQLIDHRITANDTAKMTCLSSKTASELGRKRI